MQNAPYLVVEMNNKVSEQICGQSSTEQKLTVNGLQSIQRQLLEYENDFCQSLGSEDLYEKELPATASPIVLSSHRDWRKVQLMILILVKSDPHRLLQTCNHLIPMLFAEVSRLAFKPNLLPNIGNSSKKSSTVNPRTALLEHRRLVAAVEIFLHLIDTDDSYGQLLIRFQLSDILIVLLQLCYAPIRDVSASKRSPPATIEDWLQHADRVPELEIEADGVVCEMQRDRVRLNARLQRLLDQLYQPYVIDTFLRMLNAKSPNWLRKAVSSQLSRQLLKQNGLWHLLLAVGQVFDRDTPYLQLEQVAMLICRAPSTTADSEYCREMGRQIEEILNRSDVSRAQMRLLIITMNCFLTHKSEHRSIESIFVVCFSKFVALLRAEKTKPDLRITSNDIERHLQIVDCASGNLPKDSALLEGLALFLPIYLKLALFSLSTTSSEAKLYLETISNLASKLTDGAEVIVACLNVNDVRFQLPNMLHLSVDDEGRVEIASNHGTSFTPSMEKYRECFRDFFQINKELSVKICLKLTKSFIETAESVNDGHERFLEITSAILLELTPLCEETISQSEEFSTEFLVQNAQKISRSDDPQSILKLIEIFVENSNQLSTSSKQRLVAAVDSLQSIEGDFQSKGVSLSKTILENLSDIESVQTSKSEFSAWKFAPALLKLLANKHWNLGQSCPEERVHSAGDELAKHVSERCRRKTASSVFGTMSEYQKVKDELLDPDVAIRGHGFIQLRKLLCARDAQTLQDLDNILQLCKLALNEEEEAEAEEPDSYVYLGAVQCYAQIVELRTAEHLPHLIEAFVKSKSSRVKLLLAETLNRCIPSFGDMSPVYAENVVKASIDCCQAQDELTKVSACSLLGQTVPHLSNRSLYFRQSMSIFVLLITTDPSEMVKRAAAEALTKALKLTDNAVLVNDYPNEIRDVHRVIKGLYNKCADDSLRLHFQEILLTFGELAKMLLLPSRPN